MKKLFCLLAALLLLVSMTAFAGAEGAYELTKEVFSDPEYLGTPKVQVSDEPFVSQGIDKWFIFCVDYNDEAKQISLYGFNEKGQPEVTLWEDVSLDKALFGFVGMCGIWDLVEAECDPGYKMVVWFDYEDNDLITVENSEEAAIVLNAFMEE